MSIKVRLLFLYIFVGVLINNCSSLNDLDVFDIYSPSEKKIIEGKRFDISIAAKEIAVNPDMVEIPVKLEQVIKNSDWSQKGKNNYNSPGNLLINDNIKFFWKKDIGDGEGTYNKIYAQPVGDETSIYVLDSEGKLVAISLKDGSIVWEKNIFPRDESINSNIDGGLALVNKSLIVSTSYGEIINLNSENGDIRWKKNIYKPVQGPPAINNDIIYQMTVNNELYVLDLNTADELWRYSASHVSAISNGNSSLTVTDDLVIFPSNTGEIVALDALTGSLIWNSSLVIEGAISGSIELTDIDSGPVVNSGLIYSSSLSGKFAVLDLITGKFIWEIAIKTSNDPIINGDSVFIVSNDGRVINLLRSNGEVRWISNIYKEVDIKSNSTPICSTPILAKNNIFLVCQGGDVFKVEGSTGKYNKLFNLNSSSFIAPIIINGHIIFYTEDAEVIVYR
jgi:outer membrane protein assembly factor BamB